MNLNQIIDSLKQAFQKEGHRIVFWYDAAKDFESEIPHLHIDDVLIVNMANESFLGTKLKLELEDKKGKYLLYFPMQEPSIEEDWLLDIKLYSRTFYADRISIIFNDLGLANQSMREHLHLREKFFRDKARSTALKKWIQPDFNEPEIDLAMIAVLTKAEDVTLSNIIFSIALETADRDVGLENKPNSISELEKYGLSGSLVSALKIQLGYPATHAELLGEEEFSFGRFMVRLLVTGFCEGVGEVPEWATGLFMPSASAQASVRALTSRWLDSTRYYNAFDKISEWVSGAIRIKEKIADYDLAALSQVSTFEVIEKEIIIQLSQAIPSAGNVELTHFKEVIGLRLDNYWASRLKDDDTRKKYRRCYTALNAAIDLFSLRQKYISGFNFTSCQAIYHAYQHELYLFDMSYRHYWEASLKAHINIFKDLNVAVEECYVNWYMDNLAKNWGENLQAEDKLSHWEFSDVLPQQGFYKNFVEPMLDKAKNKRVVVIISDAFRFEAAVELKDRLNQKRYCDASLGSQLGVVPSYTTLGMASLLPHHTLEYPDNNDDDVYVDGLSTKGTISRNKVMNSYGGIAITSEILNGWSREDGREALKEQQLIYVYHNVVDARGDDAATEDKTFDAVEDAIEELSEMVKKIILNFNTSTVIVTADHGFIFQQTKLDSADKTSLAVLPSEFIKSKKRYVIGHNLPLPKDALFGSTKNTAGTLSDTQFWIPKGANRFHFVGGARFVHGGSMPQEIVVPVLTARSLRGEEAKKRTKLKVGVISVKSTLKMVNNIQSFELMQTEPIDENMLPITISAAIYGLDKMVSSEAILTFDSDSDAMSSRAKQAKLSLSGTDYDRSKDYFLVLKDKDLNIELQRYKVTIDLAFTDDFF